MPQPPLEQSARLDPAEADRVAAALLAQACAEDVAAASPSPMAKLSLSLHIAGRPDLDLPPEADHFWGGLPRPSTVDRPGSAPTDLP